MHEAYGSRQEACMSLCTWEVSVAGAVQCWSLVGLSLLVFVRLGCFRGGLAIYIVAAQTHLHLSLLLLTFRLLRTRYLLFCRTESRHLGPSSSQEPRSGACPTRCYLLVSFSLYHLFA